MGPKPATEGLSTPSESFSITLKGALNPSLHHPSWYYVIGQLSKEDADLGIQDKNLYVTPTESRFSAPSFHIACDPKRWRIETRDKTARLRILQIALKTFDNLLPETRLEQIGFKFTFVMEFSHRKTTDFLAKLAQNLTLLEGKGKTVITVLSTVTGDPPRKKKVQIHSSPGQDRAHLTFSFSYSVPDDKMFTLRQLSMIEDYDLDYEESVTHAEQVAYELATAVKSSRLDAQSN